MFCQKLSHFLLHFNSKTLSCILTMLSPLLPPPISLTQPRKIVNQYLNLEQDLLCAATQSRFPINSFHHLNN